MQHEHAEFKMPIEVHSHVTRYVIRYNVARVACCCVHLPRNCVRSALAHARPPSANVCQSETAQPNELLSGAGHRVDLQRARLTQDVRAIAAG